MSERPTSVFSCLERKTVVQPAYTLLCKNNGSQLVFQSFVYLHHFIRHLAEDTVYMENEEHRNEYVLEENGCIWKGVSGQIHSVPWNFDQVQITTVKERIRFLDSSGVIVSTLDFGLDAQWFSHYSLLHILSRSRSMNGYCIANVILGITQRDEQHVIQGV